MYASFRVNPGGGDVCRRAVSLKKVSTCMEQPPPRSSAQPYPSVREPVQRFTGHFADYGEPGILTHFAAKQLGRPHAHFLRLQVGMPNRIEWFQKQRNGSQPVRV